MTESYLTDTSSIEDRLRFADFRGALGKVLLSSQTPLTVGIFGSWGSGKTSLLRMLKKDAKSNEGIRTVWFTAWKYDRQEALWRALILRVIDRLYPQMGRDPGENQLDSHGETGEDTKLVKHLQRLEESVYRPVEWQELGRLTADWSKLLPQAGKAAGALAAAFIPGGGFIQQVIGKLSGGEEVDAKEAASAIRREVHRHRREQLTSMEQFESTFREALKMALSGAAGKSREGARLIVFIDDLDRCLPEKAVEILEAIKLFLDVEGVVFVLGMDAEVIERGVEVRYGSLLGESGRHRGELPIKGSTYLQKIIQIPFQLPALSVEDVSNYLKGLSESSQNLPELSDISREVFARGVFPNPRQIKRALNIFQLLKEIALERELQGSLPAGSLAWPLLVKTVLIQTQWPNLYREWRERPTLLKSLEEE